MSPSALRVFGVILLAGCSPVLREIRRGESSYDAGRYRQAYEAFHQALERTGDPTLHYSVGNALYRMRRYEEAARSFREATAVPRLRQASYYNLGNAYVRAAEDAPEKSQFLTDAITAYQEALRLEPHDSAAKWNLELALRRRGEDRESGGSPGRGRSADYGRGNMNVPGYEGNPEAAAGAMAGGGYGAGEGESAEELHRRTGSTATGDGRARAAQQSPGQSLAGGRLASTGLVVQSKLTRATPIRITAAASNMRMVTVSCRTAQPRKTATIGLT